MSLSTSSEPEVAPVLDEDKLERIAYFLAVQKAASNAYWKQFVIQILLLPGFFVPFASPITLLVIVVMAAILSYRPITVIGARKEWSVATCKWIAICFGIHYPIFFALGFGLIPMLCIRLGVVSGLRKEGVETLLLWYRRSDLEHLALLQSDPE